MIYTGNDFDAVYHDLCADLINAPCVEVRSDKTRELVNVQLVLNKPRRRFLTAPSRNISMRYCMGELCWYLGGRQDLKSIAAYSKFWERVSDDGVLVNSAYGYRLFSALNESGKTQLDYAFGCLKDDPYTRKAVMMITSPDDAHASKDNPCTIGMQFLVRGGALSAYTTMRSNDLWLGLPYDLPFFTLVQEILYVMLKKRYAWLKLGTYTHTATSMHAYERNWPEVSKVSRDKPTITRDAPELTTVDVDGWFDDLLTYERSKRHLVVYKDESKKTEFQEWCKQFLD